MKYIFFVSKIKLIQYLKKENNKKIIINEVGVTPPDLNELINKKCINDAIINAYNNLLVIHAGFWAINIYSFSSFFMPSLVKNGIEKSKKIVEHIDISTFKFLLVPLYTPGHWSTIFIDIEANTLEFYDSLGLEDDNQIKLLQMYIEELIQSKNLSEKGLKIDYITSPRQRNEFDCGVYICLFNRSRIFGKQILFNEYQIDAHRLMLAHEIIEKRIIYAPDHQLEE